MHLVGFAIEIYYDKRPYERQICDLNITRPYVPCFKYGLKTTVEITVQNGSVEVLSTVVEMWTTLCVSFSFIRDPTAVVPVVLMGVSVPGLGSAVVMSGSVTNRTTHTHTRSSPLSVGHSQNLLFITNCTLRLHNNANKSND